MYEDRSFEPKGGSSGSGHKKGALWIDHLFHNRFFLRGAHIPIYQTIGSTSPRIRSWIIHTMKRNSTVNYIRNTLLSELSNMIGLFASKSSAKITVHAELGFYWLLRWVLKDSPLVFKDCGGFVCVYCHSYRSTVAFLHMLDMETAIPDTVCDMHDTI
jgi:hypothetical protein